MILPLLLLGGAFIAIQLYVLLSAFKNIQGENFLMPSARKYALQLRVEKWFGWVHNRSERPAEYWKEFWMKFSKEKQIKS